MTDLIEAMCADANSPADDDIDEQKAIKTGIKAVISSIAEKELSPRQRECLKMKYYEKMNQEQIAESLNLSQPTVSRHISAAIRKMRKILFYCVKALKAANKSWIETLY
ncbi:MAG: sigma-70 family RNA polymerase sigma factor [Clostridiales bacterium]|nr:sigma-70 family RNA polymerase sigma factor [Clostridiales bacterium]MCD7872550.1 sigma-70 family RNA polymerase sigma factor [Clostridiales bacterium]